MSLPIRPCRFPAFAVFGPSLIAPGLLHRNRPELRRMNDYTSNIDLAMHVCHHQLYWEKNNENEQDGFTWSRSEYVEYVAEEIEKLPVVTKFLESFRSTDSGPARPLRTNATPNDQELGPPEAEADKRVKTLKAEISQRFKKHLAKARNKEQSSASESETPKGPVKGQAYAKETEGCRRCG